MEKLADKYQRIARQNKAARNKKGA